MQLQFSAAVFCFFLTVYSSKMYEILVFTLHSGDWTSDGPDPGIPSLSVETSVIYPLCTYF